MKFWRRAARDAAPIPDVGADRRVYAIGDVHGRIDLLDALLAMIAQDDKDRPRKAISLILLGDLVDRGAESRAVVERVMALCASGGDVVCLKGNHEEAFILAARGDVRALPLFRRMEGEATLASYGLPPALFWTMSDEEVAAWMATNVPRAHVDFLDSMPDSVAIGDYLFVHAGIRPGIPIEEQSANDLRWIRQEFLGHRGVHPKMVVHGHSISREVDQQAGRIGIDTGAYFSGRLTAIGLEGTERWVLQTGT
ncbi:metallophosphoesterase family protein [Sphingobium sp. CR2-8]|uniref:metallophosphoesterase family protein n=1 Tax=Sphingobium sp. CR2-8 TaxID=1306534 RepID=UPI002DBB7A43|nr:metallophosphoesterase family protein [Sphingobium sp. CR2-8]MEC3910825.1 metallophosphoesterase family protein [Sphingobium sp. CR2-8]